MRKFWSASGGSTIRWGGIRRASINFRLVVGRRLRAGAGAGTAYQAGLAVWWLMLSALSVGTTSAQAQPLDQALAEAYRTNPELNAARARLKAIDESYVQAQSGWRPTISGSADYAGSNLKSRPRSVNDGRAAPGGYAITLNQPVFRGLRTWNAVKRSKAEIEAAREDLRQTEQTLLLFAVSAYLDVLRDARILSLRESNARLLQAELRGVRRRLDVKVATRTDEAQTIARQAVVISELKSARANLETSRANFERVFGFLPGRLSDPGARHKLVPQSIEAARALAERESPRVIAATFRRAAARFATAETRGQLLPQVDLQASYEGRYSPTGTTDQTNEMTVLGRINIPIYQAGTVRSQIRQSLQNETVAKLDAVQARRVARADLVAAWSRLVAAQGQIMSDTVNIEASSTALMGVRRERDAGQRTTLDVLNADQALLQARIRLATTRRELVLASYRVIAGIGRLTAEHLALPTILHDKTDNLREVVGQSWGYTIVRP